MSAKSEVTTSVKFCRSELMDGAYAEANVVSDRTIDSHVRRVRQKFAAA